MTGFGTASASTAAGTIRVDIRSVNQKNRELRVYASPRDIALENEIQKMIASALVRGKIDVRINVETGSAGRIDAAAVQRLRGRLYRLKHHLGPQAQGAALKLAMESDASAAPQAEQILPSVATALDALLDSRRSEGQGLQDVVTGQIEAMQKQIAQVVACVADEREQRRAALTERLEVLRDGGLADSDRQRIEDEVTFQLIRSDIAEEIDRLKLHLSSLEGLLQTPSPVGKKLDVLAQEIGREVHTLASKSSSVEAKQAGVELRVIADQLREQVQNVE